MKKIIIALGVSLLIAGCAGVLHKKSPVCTGTVLIGGQESEVQIYGIRKQNNQTMYQAGYPFNWKWVGKNNFISTTCEK